MREDRDVRNFYVEDEKVFRRLMDEGEIFLKIFPLLFFEVLCGKQRRPWKKPSSRSKSPWS